jgi:hypothetical protein
MGEIEPVGFVRLKVLEFVLFVALPPFFFPFVRAVLIHTLCSALVQSNYEAVDKALVETDILSSSFDLFFRYPWNNFLHSLVEKIVRQIFQGSNDNLKEAVIKRAKLAEKIAEADTANAAEVYVGLREVLVMECSFVFFYQEQTKGSTQRLHGTPHTDCCYHPGRSDSVRACCKGVGRDYLLENIRRRYPQRAPQH